MTQSEYVRKLERQVVLADSQVCAALLTLLQQELGGYVRGGWMLRKAWRVYQHTYNQILQLYRRTFGSSPSGESAQPIFWLCLCPEGRDITAKWLDEGLGLVWYFEGNEFFFGWRCTGDRDDFVPLFNFLSSASLNNRLISVHNFSRV